MVPGFLKYIMRSNYKTVLIMFAFLLFVAPCTFARETLRLYVFTTPPAAGLVDEESKRRLDSVKDLVHSLEGHKKTIALVENAGDADVLIEVFGSGWVDTEETKTKAGVLFPPGVPIGVAHTRPVDRQKIGVRISVPRLQYTTEIESHVRTAIWKHLANDVAEQINDWVKENRARLTTDRQ